MVVDAARSYFDTNTGDHQHFFVEDEGTLIDIPGDTIAVAGVPAPPKGTDGRPGGRGRSRAAASDRRRKYSLFRIILNC